MLRDVALADAKEVLPNDAETQSEWLCRWVDH
jgi:hypothetical protein